MSRTANQQARSAPAQDQEAAPDAEQLVVAELEGQAAEVTAANGQRGEAPLTEAEVLAAEQSLAEQDPDYEAGHGQSRRRNYWAGASQRKQRVEENTYLLFLEKKRETERELDRELTDEELEALREEARVEVTTNPLSELDMKTLDEWAPTSTCADEDDQAFDRVVIAAVMRLPLIAWLYSYLCRAFNAAGYAPARRLVAATFMQMAFGSGVPRIESTRASFTSNPALNWAYDYPADDLRTPPAKTQFNNSLQVAARR